MIIADQQKMFMSGIVGSLTSNRLPITDTKVESIIKFNKENADILQSFNYDPYYSYRKNIESQDVNKKVLCFTYWYLEGYYLQLRDCYTANVYTQKICSLLKLNYQDVKNRINIQLLNY